MQKLITVIPMEARHDFADSLAFNHKDVLVVNQYHPRQRRWPGSQRNVKRWIALVNGFAVGIMETEVGFGFPVIRHRE